MIALLQKVYCSFPGKRSTIHGNPCRKDCSVITISEVIQVEADPWFKDAFGEKLSKGIMVEWPSHMLCSAADVSPMHTRQGKKRSKK